jgi:photosystem II stability/assembly factor-like uncharacterized protein
MRMPRSVLFLILTAACSSDDAPGDGGPMPPGEAGPIAEEADQCGPSVEAGAGDAWTTMKLVNDVTNPDRPITHIGADFVTGIHYSSPDQGVIVTQDDGLMNPRGGAVFKANATAVTSIAFGGDETGINHMGTIDFTGLEKTPTGYIAMAYASEVIGSDDGGATFGIKLNAPAGRFSIDRVLAFAVSATGATLIHDNGVIATSASAPGPTSSYDDVWKNSQGNAMCPDGPRSTTVPITHASVYVSPGRTRIAYTANPSSTPMVCKSIDGGRSFTAQRLTVPNVARPTGVLFPTKKVGIAWYGSANTPAYIRRTDDGGATWREVALPAAIATHNVDLPGGYFAPDCMHVWLAGFDLATSQALLLASSDAGATWSVVPGVGDAVAAANGDKLYTVFALDTAHIWVGGARGVIAHN